MDHLDSPADFFSKRDVTNFIKFRNAQLADEYLLGELLVRSFRESYTKNLPSAITNRDREMEMRDVFSRRRDGVVRVVEVGLQIIATYSLLAPFTPSDESWTENTCTLRCLAIDPLFHSLPLVGFILDDAISLAKKLSTDFMCMHVQKGLDAVAQIYQGFGFKRCHQGDRVIMGRFMQGFVLDLNSVQLGLDRKNA